MRHGPPSSRTRSQILGDGTIMLLEVAIMMDVQQYANDKLNFRMTTILRNSTFTSSKCASKKNKVPNNMYVKMLF